MTFSIAILTACSTVSWMTGPFPLLKRLLLGLGLLRLALIVLPVCSPVRQRAPAGPAPGTGRLGNAPEEPQPSRFPV
jgi:hypothetical protein